MTRRSTRSSCPPVILSSCHPIILPKLRFLKSYKPTVGIIGLGIMGWPMAHNALKAGFPLFVYDLQPQSMQALLVAGALPLASPKDLAAQVDVVLLCLPDSPDVQAA